MTSNEINNLIDFGDVFNTIRKEQREQAGMIIINHCQDSYFHSPVNDLCEYCENLASLILDAPLPGAKNDD